MGILKGFHSVRGFAIWKYVSFVSHDRVNTCHTSDLPINLFNVGANLRILTIEQVIITMGSENLMMEHFNLTMEQLHHKITFLPYSQIDTHWQFKL